MDEIFPRLLTIIHATPCVPSEDLLKSSSDRLIENATGGFSVQSRVTHRLADKAEIVFNPTPEHVALFKKVLARCVQEDLARIDRSIGHDAISCTLLLPKKYGWIAAYWAATQFEAVRPDADLITITLPDWPEQKILILADLGITLVLGSDYVGETKMAFLRLAMYWTRKTGGLGLHAGSKSICLKNKNLNALFFGLSGTGKTTLCTHSLFLQKPERTVVHQDDVVLWQKDGNALGAEQNFYVKTEGIGPDRQREIWKACQTEHSLLENVAMDEAKNPNFSDTARTRNGRAIVFRKDLPYTNGVDMPGVDAVFFITRRRDIVPAAAKLTAEQAAAFFMLGESVETSAGDPTQEGKTRRVVGFNPFIVGDPAEEGNRFYQLLQAHRPACYLLNTGRIAEKVNLTADLSARLVEQIARDGVVWKSDLDWGYQVPQAVGGLDATALDPRQYYPADVYAEKTTALKAERKSWLKQFTNLDPFIQGALDVAPKLL